MEFAIAIAFSLFLLMTFILLTGWIGERYGLLWMVIFVLTAVNLGGRLFS